MTLIPHQIAGRPVESAARAGEVTDPATGQVTATVCLAGEREVDLAVSAAEAAFPGWRDTSLARRTRVLFAFRELLAARADELAEIVTAEHGKVLADARAEVARALEVVEFACGAPHLLKGAFTEQASTALNVHSARQPLGPVAVVAPFNFPVMVPMWFVPIAIAAGNTVVLKPSEKVPSAANWIARLWRRAGLPDGVFNVLHGDRAAVDALLDEPRVRAVSFVGSTPVARHVYARAAAAGKRVQALGGAKNHMVVLPDADLDLAADQAVSAGYGAAGQRCMAISAVVAVGGVGDELVERIAARARALSVGDGRGGSDMGPLVSAAARERVLGYIEAGQRDGARLVVDGRKVAARVRPGAAGHFVGPTLFDHVRPEMSVYADEIFGPVLCVLRAPDYRAAVRLVNDSPYGNGVALFTNDGGAAHRFQTEVEVGMVGVNVPIPTPVAYHSFGGWKSSLFGDAHAHGPEGFAFFTRAKVVSSRWPRAGRGGGVDLGFPRNQ